MCWHIFAHATTQAEFLRDRSPSLHRDTRFSSTVPALSREGCATTVLLSPRRRVASCARDDARRRARSRMRVLRMGEGEVGSVSCVLALPLRGGHAWGSIVPAGQFDVRGKSALVADRADGCERRLYFFARALNCSFFFDEEMSAPILSIGTPSQGIKIIAQSAQQNGGVLEHVTQQHTYTGALS